MQENDLSSLKKSLPMVPGIQGIDEYMHAAVLVLLLPIENEYHFLLQNRSAFISQAGDICFPGGKYDPKQDTSLRQTALRETEEELGLCPDKISIIGQLDTLVVPLGKTIDTFIATADYTLADIKSNPAEVEHAFTLPISFFEKNPPSTYNVILKNHPSYINHLNEEVQLLPARELGLPEQYQKPWGQFRQRIFTYQTNEGVVWGLTARIIRDICCKLRP